MAQLFRLTEYDQAFEAFLWQANRALTDLHPVMGKIERETVESIPTTRMIMPSGEIIESPPQQFKSKVFLSVDDVINGNFETLIASIYEAAQESAHQQFSVWKIEPTPVAGGKATRGAETAPPWNQRRGRSRPLPKRS